MLSGPQRFPGASTAYWYGSKYPGSAMETNVIVWHTTEGTSLPDYSGGSVAPNFTAKPDFAARRLVWYQHFGFDVSSRALVNAAGGVDTNTLNVCQVEIIGTCDPASHKKWGSTPHLYTPELPDWAIRDLAAFARWAHDNHSVPLESGLTFKAYPGSYGTSNGVRMSFSAWNGFKGHCGHQHVPENLHGDPGSLPMAAILNAAKGGTTTSEEDPLAVTDADALKIARKVLTLDEITAPKDAPDAATNPTWRLDSYTKDTNARVRALQASVTALTATNAKLVDAVAKLAAEQADLDPAAIVAELKAAIEAVTIHLDVPNA
jgi:hypothetical protein